MRDLDDDYYEYDEDSYSLIGKQTGKDTSWAMRLRSRFGAPTWQKAAGL
jgi:hypothetical protein